MDGERETRARSQNWRNRGSAGDAPDREPEAGAADEASGATAPHAPPQGSPVRDEPEPTAPEAREPVAPVAPEVERRTGEERRVRDVAVEEERRVEARRARDEASRERRRHVIDRVTLGVDYLFYLLYGLLGIRFVLSLLGAAETAGFVQFIHGVTAPFFVPFSGIVASPSINGGVIEFPIIIALLAYFLLHLAVRGLLRLLAGDRVVA